jgi:hypothetical protein
MTSKVSRCTIFQDAWLTETDHSRDTIKTWAMPSKSSSYKVFCKDCNELVSVKNGGIIRLKEHDGTDKHAKNIANMHRCKLGCHRLATHTTPKLPPASIIWSTLKMVMGYNLLDNELSV